MKQLQFIDEYGSFTAERPENISYLYFPLASETGLKSSVTPNLGGDSKLDQEIVMTGYYVGNYNNYLYVLPVSIEPAGEATGSLSVDPKSQNVPAEGKFLLFRFRQQFSETTGSSSDSGIAGKPRQPPKKSRQPAAAAAADSGASFARKGSRGCSATAARNSAAT